MSEFTEWLEKCREQQEVLLVNKELSVLPEPEKTAGVSIGKKTGGSGIKAATKDIAVKPSGSEKRGRSISEKRLLDIAEASEYLGIPANTLRCWCSRKRIPYVKLGERMVRFDRHELDEWFGKQRVSPKNFDDILDPSLTLQ